MSTTTLPFLNVGPYQEVINGIGTVFSFSDGVAKLTGPLGAGKTVLTQGIGSALGFSDVTSPTFVISRTHNGQLPLIHVDAYRLLESGNAALYLDDLDLDAAREAGLEF